LAQALSAYASQGEWCKYESILPSGKELAVLELLVNKSEMYGPEMVNASPKLRRGTVYVTLNRMEEKGYVKSRPVKEEGRAGLPKRIYSVTGLGQRARRQARESFEMAPVMEAPR